MDINYWLIGSQDFINEINGIVANVGPSNFFDPVTVSVSATQFPLLNYLKNRTKRSVKAAPAWYDNLDFRTAGGQRLIQLYSFGTNYSDEVEVREDLQEMEEAYPNDCLIAGCWNVADGQPVGGVGSPWFMTPPELIQFMPDVLIGPGITAPATKLTDVNLLAGQQPRKFV